MDMEGNIYDLRGNFIGTTDGMGDDGEADHNAVEGMEGSQIIMNEHDQFDEGDDY